MGANHATDVLRVAQIQRRVNLVVAAREQVVYSETAALLFF